MLYLALKYGGGPISLEEISEEERISHQYLGQLFVKLRKSRLVKSTRGARGGYYLAQPPSEITLTDILRAVDEPIGPIECVDPEGRKTSCDKVRDCIPHHVWKELRQSMLSVLERTTLQDMKNQHDRRQSSLGKEVATNV